MCKKLFLFVAMMLVFTACQSDATIDTSLQSATYNDSGTEIEKKIYLYGEAHGVEKILDREFELWYDYYHHTGMRHLFIEYPYYTAQFLNIWMQAEDDIILEEIFHDAQGTLSAVPAVSDFFKKIKSQCPETVFHGTDVGHQYDTTGARYLKYLQENGKEESTEYVLAEEFIAQGKEYYKGGSDNYGYREDMMVQNFIRAYDALGMPKIMGIYGSAHTNIEAMGYQASGTPCMANQLNQVYGGILYTEDLSDLALLSEPLATSYANIDGKKYTLAYFGKQEITFTEAYKTREFWRIEKSYEDFKQNELNHDVLPFDNYPMVINPEDVFVIKYVKADDSAVFMLYRNQGDIWQGEATTTGFNVTSFEFIDE